MKYILYVISTVCVISLLACPAQALEKPGEELQEVGLATELGSSVDSSLEFQDSYGKSVRLSDLVSPERPTVLVPAYYDCPMLCGLLLNGLTKLINQVEDLEIGKDYQIVTVSFDHTETPELAAKKKKIFTDKFTGKGDPVTGWHFLVGSEENVRTLMNQIGFYFKEDRDEFAHTAVIMILTPDFKISQYFTGINFPVWDFRLALVDASQGSIGSAVDHVLLYCFRFDPTKGKYTWVATGVMKIGGAITLLLLGTLIIMLRRRESLSE